MDMVFYQTQQDQEELKLSKYNAAVAQLQRIDILWRSCHLYRTHGMLMKWNEKLDCIWTELASDSSKKDDETFENFMDNIIKNSKKKNSLYQILMKKEIWLRRLQNKQGKGTAYADESEDDFE